MPAALSMPDVHDLRGFETRVLEIVGRHSLGAPGAFERWTGIDGPGERPRGPNPYGCADAANILYTLDRFPRDLAWRAGFVEHLRGFQSAEDGLFREATHDPIHTTAHCLAALELFDAGPVHALSGLEPLLDPDALVAFLESLDWRTNPWIESHRGAGLYAALHLAWATTPEWEDRYFAWLEAAGDPATGLPRGDTLGEGQRRDWFVFPALAGAFHYLFDTLHARRPIPHASALVDTCLDIEARSLHPLGGSVGFAEIDWVYCLHRAVRQSGRRREEARTALERVAGRYLPYLCDLDPERDPGLDDLHALFGAVCAVAELQLALPGRVITARPWRLVLDRRPFI